MTPARIADLVFEAMETGQFYILADNPEDLGYGAPTPTGSSLLDSSSCLTLYRDLDSILRFGL